MLFYFARNWGFEALRLRGFWVVLRFFLRGCSDISSRFFSSEFQYFRPVFLSILPRQAETSGSARLFWGSRREWMFSSASHSWVWNKNHWCRPTLRLLQYLRTCHALSLTIYCFLKHSDFVCRPPRVHTKIIHNIYTQAAGCRKFWQIWCSVRSLKPCILCRKAGVNLAYLYRIMYVSCCLFYQHTPWFSRYHMAIQMVQKLWHLLLFLWHRLWPLEETKWTVEYKTSHVGGRLFAMYCLFEENS